MKKTVKSICVLICAILVFSSFPTVYAVDSIIADSEAVLVDEKVYANATIDQDFADNRVLVVLDGKVGGINKAHDKSFFGSVDIKEIKDLTSIKNYQTQNEKTTQATDNIQNESSTINPLINKETFRQIISLELPTNSKKNVLQVIKQLEQIEGIVYAGPDYVTYTASTTPNDSYFNELWGFSKTQVTNAWDITTGSSSIRVGVIDTGIANHPDLNANLVSGWDFVNNNSVTTDDINGHGTHVAGTIAAVGNNGVGVSGVAWNVKLVPLQVSTNASGTGSVSDSIEAVTYATDNNIPILNYSRGSDDYTYALEQAIANYQGLFICSAGNDKLNLDETPYYAASYKTLNMISVANTTSSDVLEEHIAIIIDKNGQEQEVEKGSNYGAETVHLAVPGTSILSCYPTSKCLDGTHVAGSHYANGYHYDTGTSMASPLVAGVAALMASANPDLTPLQIKAIILNTVDRKTSLAGKCISGGRLNAYEAVRIARGLYNNNLSTADQNKADYIFDAYDYTIEMYVGKRSTLTIPASINGVNVTTIAANAFSDSRYAKNVTIPATITSMETEVFSGCTSLTTVSIPSSITSLPGKTFKGCTSLTNVSLPSNLTGISNEAFMNCYALKSINLPSGIKNINGRVFYGCSRLESIVLPGSLTGIYSGAFGNCKKLESLVIPVSVTTMASNAFDGCDKLVLFVSSGSTADEVADLNSITACVFSSNSVVNYIDGNNNSANRIDIPSSVFGSTITYISGNAFAGSDNLEIISIPNTVTTIGYKAFQTCQNLKTVVIPSSVTSISNSMNSNIIVYSDNATICCMSGSYAEKYANDNNIPGMVMHPSVSSPNTECYLYVLNEEGSGRDEYIIPESIQGLAVTEISEGALSVLDFTNISILSPDIELNEYTFAYCPNLTNVYIYSRTATLYNNSFDGVDTSNVIMHCYIASNAYRYAAENDIQIKLMA